MNEVAHVRPIKRVLTSRTTTVTFQINGLNRIEFYCFFLIKYA